MAEAMTAAGPAPSRRRLRHLSTAVGAVLALGGGAFVVERLASGWSAYGEVVTQARWGWTVAGLALAVAGMTAMGLVWRRVVAALGGHASRRQVYVWYMLGNLGKYVPGGVWALLGRAELAVRGGLPRPVAYHSVALSMGATYLCATVVCALLLPFLVVSEVELAGGQLWVFGFIPVGLAALHPVVLRRVFRFSERLFGKGEPVVVPRWLTSVGLVAWHALPWLALGVATWWVALTFAPGAPLLIVLFAGILSWVVGFVAFPVPGGIGVREAVFTAIVSVAIAPHLAATIAIVSRLVFVAADGLGAVAGLLLARGARRVRG